MTFYELLNVSRDSSSEEIELAFSVRLAEFSREAATGSEGAAKKISDLKHARKMLTDPKLRAEYDKALTADENLNASPVNLRKSPRVSLTKPEIPEEVFPEPEVPQKKPEPVQTEAPQPEQIETHDESQSISAGAYFITNAIALAVFIVLIIIVSNSV